MTAWRRCVIALVLLTAACASGGGPVQPAEPYDFAPWGQDDYQYRLGAGDALRLGFVVETDLDADVVLGPDGQGAFPTIGPVPLGGMTVRDASQRLTEAYARVLRNPQVLTPPDLLRIKSEGVGGVEVSGEGIYPPPDEATLAEVRRDGLTILPRILGGLNPVPRDGWPQLFAEVLGVAERGV